MMLFFKKHPISKNQIETIFPVKNEHNDYFRGGWSDSAPHPIRDKGNSPMIVSLYQN